jgi:hypothetical protein
MRIDIYALGRVRLELGLAVHGGVCERVSALSFVYGTTAYGESSHGDPCFVFIYGS